MVKGIISLRKVYTSAIIEDACMRTLEHGKHDYKQVKLNCHSIEKESNARPKSKIRKGINGYYHDLNVYMRLINKA